MGKTTELVTVTYDTTPHVVVQIFSLLSALPECQVIFSILVPLVIVEIK